MTEPTEATGSSGAGDDPECSCCGRTVAAEDLARLLCHPEVAVCGGCATWLATWSKTLVRAVPVLATEDLATSVAFWRAAGFDVEAYGDDFALAERDGVELHLVVPAPDGHDRGGSYLHVRDIDTLHAAWAEAGLPVTALRVEPWGMREFTVVDPAGNRIRVGTNI